jgi:hypothetical protein
MSRIARVAPKPMPIETRPPRAVRVSMSRPKLSVPNGWSKLTDWLFRAKSTLFGS